MLEPISNYPAPRWLRVSAYAAACGLSSPTAITGRIRRGTLPAVESQLPGGGTAYVIDTLAHPPGRRQRRHRIVVPARPKIHRN